MNNLDYSHIDDDYVIFNGAYIEHPSECVFDEQYEQKSEQFNDFVKIYRSEVLPQLIKATAGYQIGEELAKYFTNTFINDVEVEFYNEDFYL